MNRLNIAVFSAGFCTFINLYPTQALLPTLAKAFGTSLAHTGLTVTASLVAVALVAPFVGGISDAMGRYRLICGAAFLLAVPTLLAAIAPSLTILIACRFGQGLLLPFIFAVTVAYIAEECPGPDAIRATGIYSIGTIIGGFGGRFIAGWTAELIGWRASFVVLAALTLSAATIIAVCLPRERRFRPVQGLRGSLRGFNDQLRNNQVMATCGIGFAVLFSTVAAFTYANFLLAAPPYNLGPAQLGTVFVVYLLAAIATPIAGRLALRIGRKNTVVIGGAITAAGLLLTLGSGLPIIILGLAFVAAGIFIEQVMSIGYVALAARQSRSTAVGLYVTCYYIGGSLGGVLPAGIWSHLGWPGCVALTLLVQAVALAIAWRVWPDSLALR